MSAEIGCTIHNNNSWPIMFCKAYLYSKATHSKHGVRATWHSSGSCLTYSSAAKTAAEFLWLNPDNNSCQACLLCGENLLESTAHLVEEMSSSHPRRVSIYPLKNTIKSLTTLLWERWEIVRKRRRENNLCANQKRKKHSAHLWNRTCTDKTVMDIYSWHSLALNISALINKMGANISKSVSTLDLNILLPTFCTRSLQKWSLTSDTQPCHCGVFCKYRPLLFYTKTQFVLV